MQLRVIRRNAAPSCCHFQPDEAQSTADKPTGGYPTLEQMWNTVEEGVAHACSRCGWSYRFGSNYIEPLGARLVRAPEALTVRSGKAGRLICLLG